MIKLSCGHTVTDFENTYDVDYDSEYCDAIEGFKPCVVHTTVCFTCYTRDKELFGYRITNQNKEIPGQLNPYAS